MTLPKKAPLEKPCCGTLLVVIAVMSTWKCELEQSQTCLQRNLSLVEFAAWTSQLRRKWRQGKKEPQLCSKLRPILNHWVHQSCAQFILQSFINHYPFVLNKLYQLTVTHWLLLKQYISCEVFMDCDLAHKCAMAKHYGRKYLDETRSASSHWQKTLRCPDSKRSTIDGNFRHKTSHNFQNCDDLVKQEMSDYRWPHCILSNAVTLHSH